PGSVIAVTSVLPQAGQVAPKDLKPQAEVGKPPPTWPLPVAVSLATLVALVLITLFARRQLRKRRVTRALRRVPVYTGPEDEARAQLDRAATAYQETGDLNAYSTALANTTRNYLTRRYNFPAFALTTRELESAMLRMGLDRWQVRVATGLLSQ